MAEIRGQSVQGLGHRAELQSEVLNQTTVAALAYLDFFLANVASDPDPV